MELTKNRVLLERVKKESLLTSGSEKKYDYEKNKFKVIQISELVENKTLVGKTIVKQELIGVKIELNGKEFIVITEDDILATI